MTALVHEPIAAPDPLAVSTGHAVALRLVPHRDACCLLDPRGQVVLQVPGRDGRRRCLEFARRHGVLFLLA